MKNNFKISIIGLGYVGLPLAIEFGKFFETVGFDISKPKLRNYKTLMIVKTLFHQICLEKQKNYDLLIMKEN